MLRNVGIAQKRAATETMYHAGNNVSAMRRLHRVMVQLASNPRRHARETDVDTARHGQEVPLD
jgi:hypothetical protein